MACDCCRSLDLDGLLRGDKLLHHPTFKELKACSSLGDCQLCEWVACDLENQLQTDGFESRDYDEAKIYYHIPGFIFNGAKLIESWHGISHVVFVVLEYWTNVEFFVARGSRLAESKIISGRPISAYADDESCFKLARKWRDTCLEKHQKSCLIPTKRSLPTRVIDVGPANGSQQPWLRISKRECGEWVALSHCWGKTSRFVTNSSNILARKCSIPLKDMPQTFQDAVFTTRKLGYRYLWIDSLCILQNDHEDWVAESSRMGEYYRYATITISADSASGDHIGFLKQHRIVPNLLKVTLSSNIEIGVRREIRCPDFRDRDTYTARRAWTLQEFVLAPRSLHYTSGQIVWECHTRKYCESDDNSQGDLDGDLGRCVKRFFSMPSMGDEQFPDFQGLFSPSQRWYNLVDDYMRRDLTCMEDILPAISGLAKEIHKQTGNTYAAGIWMEEIHKGLLWRTFGAGQRSKTYYAPSWSWASVGILSDRMKESDDMYWVAEFQQPEAMGQIASLISYEVVPKDNDPFGRVSSGSIYLRGRVLLASNWQGETNPHFNFYNGADRSHFGLGVDDELLNDSKSEGLDQLICYFDVLEEDVAPEETLGKILIFQISSWAWNEGYPIIILALLLIQVTDEPTETYRRVGVAEVPNFEGMADEGWEMKDIRII